MNDRYEKIDQLEKAISAQESLRGTVDGSVIQTAIETLQKELDEVLSSSPDFEQQRKMVTVLFLDIVNSTQMIRDRDPEESMQILDVSLQTMSESVMEYGGHVSRFMGDGFLAVFGLPSARENDPEQAVHAALSIIVESEKVSRSLKRDWGIDSFQIRIGINTGLIASGGVTEAGDTIMGSTINLAARLEKAARPGTVLVSRHTYQHIRGVFEMEKQKPVEAKGFSGPVETYSVLRLKPQTFQLSNRGVEGVETHMVGREVELQRLQIAAQKVIQTGDARIVTITGEAGMGKSRLLHEFETWSNLHLTQTRMYKGRATYEAQKQPFSLFRAIFARQFKILDDDPVALVKWKFLDGFQSAIQKDEQIELKAYTVGRLVGYGIEDEAIKKNFENPQLARERAFQYIKSYFQAACKESPIQIFLDDIHWADESSLDLLDHLRVSLVDIPILILALTRPLLFERRSGWGNGENCETLNLMPLSGEQSEQLVMEVLQNAEFIPEMLRKMIVDHAEGNPYYVEELVKMLVDDGVIVKEDPFWQIQADQLVDLHIPSTLTGIIQARLDGLPKSEFSILQQASVVGKVFWDATLVFMIKDRSSVQSNVPALLKSLQNRDLIFQRSTSAFSGTTEYSYGHGILRDVVYETVLLKQRKNYHSLIADWMIDQHGDGVLEMHGVIADHLIRAERAKEAVTYFLRAAESAAQKYANEEAVVLYQQALDLISDKEPEKQYSILCSMESLWFLLGNREAQLGVLNRLANLSEQLNDLHKKIDTLLRRAWYLFYTSNFPEMLKTAQAVIDLADPSEFPNELQEGYYALAWAQMQTDDLDNAKTSAKQSLELAERSGHRLGEGNVHNVLGLIDLTQGRYADAHRHVEKFLLITEKSGNQKRQMVALNSMVVIQVIQGDFKKAKDYGLRQLALALDLGDRTNEGSAYVNLAWAASAESDWQTAEEYATKGIPIKRDTHHLEALGEGLVWLGYSKLGLGQLKEAADAFQESFEIRQKLGLDALQIESMAGLGLVMLKQGNLDGAREYGEKILEHLGLDGDLSGTWEPLKIYWFCYQILQANGDSRKNNFLKETVENLQKRAEKIADKSAQNRYLNNVPWHREILSEWKRVQNR